MKNEIDHHTLFLDVSDNFESDSKLSCNVLDYSFDDLCNELSLDKDLVSARNFIEIDVENPPHPCFRFNFIRISAVNVQVDDTSNELQFYKTFIDSLINKIIEETNRYEKQCIETSIAVKLSKIIFWEEITKKDFLL